MSNHKNKVNSDNVSIGEVALETKTEQNFAKLIENYKKLITVNRLKDEKYKWELLHNFHGRPNLDAPDFYTEIKSIKFGNLMYAMGVAVIHHLAKDKPEEMRLLFKKLFNESVPLKDRIKAFNVDSLQIYRSLGETLAHHQDERTIATYLTFHNPEKYTFYKFSFYKKLCILLNEKVAVKNEKYIHYLQLINRLDKEYIRKDLELIDLVKSIIPEYYDGSSNLLLIQDILFQMLHMNQEGDEDNVKEAFIDWLIANESGGNYFINQFGAKRDRLEEELNSYEEEYKSEFKTELFRVKDEKYENHIKEVSSNIYNTATSFSNFSKDHFSGRPTAILGREQYLKFLEECLAEDEDDNITELIEKESMNNPLNQILYGPPGTGKTYNTINSAISIINPSFDIKQTRAAVKTEYERHVESGQIVFTTFHQSMSYEDFIEGIKPKTVLSHLQYDIEDGVFKSLVRKALVEYIRKDSSSEETNDFDTLYNDFVKSIKSSEGKREGTFKTKTGVEIMLVEANNNSILVKYVWSDNSKKDSEGQHVFSVTKEKLKKVLLEGIDPAKIKSLKADLHPLIGHIHCELFAVYKSFYDFVIANKGEIETIHFDENELSFEDVKEQFDLLTKEDINSKTVKPYVIIIDEINRGNVSAIFGELITLIEDDKRLGKDEALEVILPYSKAKFGVPPNLYIIGTMNTADRSVEALDTALRRRFSFEEMMPEYAELVEIQIEGFNLADILKTINERIEVLLDRDHTIGHSYFLKVSSEEQLKATFKNNIIPLLQEYFYGDYEKIGLIVGSGFFEKSEKFTKELFASFETQNHPDSGSILRLKTIDENFDIVGAIKLLLNI
ncbi:McrB family protein [Flavobacterium algicola]|uniref:McrB family protein n=1 Tax=Flavobacterium algicola TaxID=556529 RepID=UPI001EFDCB72|nr:AAA family ATPase [Flavobacterium algicola]MCG9792800.1 AAA family ATPase [Flavobacterium algicola]